MDRGMAGYSELQQREFALESSGFQLSGDRQTGSYYDTNQAGMQIRARASYDGLKAFREGQAVIAFGSMVVDTNMFYSNPGHAKAMRVTRFVALPPPDEQMLSAAPQIGKLRDLLVNKTWTAMKADVRTETQGEITALNEGFEEGLRASKSGSEASMLAVVAVYGMSNPLTRSSSNAQVAAAIAQAPGGQQLSNPIPGFGKQGDGDPLGVFAKGPADGAIQRPLNWDELSQAEDDNTPRPGKIVQLDPETEDLLRKAGEAARRALFGNGENDEGE